MTSFGKGFTRQAMSCGATEKQANDLLAAAEPHHVHWGNSKPALHVGNDWRHNPANPAPVANNYVMSPVRVAGSLAENSLNPNAVTTPSKTIQLPMMYEKEFKYNPENRFDFSSEGTQPINNIAAIK